MAYAIPEVPQFCLGGTMYPVDNEFDWTGDEDVLIDAIRETHIAARTHHLATLTPDSSWLQCPCPDKATHARELLQGHFSLLNRVLIMDKQVVSHRPKELPVMNLFMRLTQAFGAVALVTKMLPLI